MSQFTGFSEDDLERIKSGETADESKNKYIKNSNIKRVKLSMKTKPYEYKTAINQKQDSDDGIDSIDFDKCKLSLKTPTSPSKNAKMEEDKQNQVILQNNVEGNDEVQVDTIEADKSDITSSRRSSTAPDIVRGVDFQYTEHELASHKVKLGELQLKQKIMEEQNKKRKEMIAKALADRTKQTEEEVMKLEKIKKELQVLDSQFSQDVSVLRKKIDQACLSYADAEKQYLRVEKEFLNAKIQLQKEKEKKELLTEHLCALITHNEMRKAQKLETLMLELANEKKNEINEALTLNDDNPVIIDGVDERTGKMVEINTNKS
ncbi:RAB6-interacting golgin [Bombyx mandarina]|uniref:RAB6-interacting golgin n=1 Tax=Bombyx mandarina TaxID=7092 RepID=A0A6J2JHT8_BOMMA|nr:RAB6-interacting golgin [Bombyx mandarina]